MNNLIFPRALMIAAKTFGNKPKVVGEILCALVAGSDGKDLTEVQRYIVAECREEMNERETKRKANAERKAKQRARSLTAPQKGQR